MPANCVACADATLFLAAPAAGFYPELLESFASMVSILLSIAEIRLNIDNVFLPEPVTRTWLYFWQNLVSLAHQA